MFLPIREGIAEVFHELKQLREDAEHTEGWAESFENQLGRALGREVKLARAQSVKRVQEEGCQTAPETVVSSTPDLRKRLREKTVKRPKGFTKEEESVEVPARKNLRKKAVLIKPAKGVSYAAILKNLKQRVKLDELGVTVHEMRRTRSEDLLVELKCFKEGRGRR